MFLSVPFASKELPNGKKLFRRAHGYTIQLVANGDATLTVTVPYAACKINKAEVIGCPEGVKVDLKILDSTTGTYTGVSNYQLNQFGFDINISKDFFEDHSPYDADLFVNMQVVFVFKNSTDSTKTIGVNIPFHEVVNTNLTVKYPAVEFVANLI